MQMMMADPDLWINATAVIAVALAAIAVRLHGPREETATITELRHARRQSPRRRGGGKLPPLSTQSCPGPTHTGGDGKDVARTATTGRGRAASSSISTNTSL
jgi:hypothetical protein